MYSFLLFLFILLFLSSLPLSPFLPSFLFLLLFLSSLSLSLFLLSFLISFSLHSFSYLLFFTYPPLSFPTSSSSSLLSYFLSSLFLLSSLILLSSHPFFLFLLLSFLPPFITLFSLFPPVLSSSALLSLSPHSPFSALLLSSICCLFLNFSIFFFLLENKIKMLILSSLYSDIAISSTDFSSISSSSFTLQLKSNHCRLKCIKF